MRKIVTLALAGLLAFALLGPASAAKKKKPKKPPAPVPVELQFFLRAEESCAEAYLSLTDGEDVDCLYSDSFLNPLYAGPVGGATGIDPVIHYTAADGVPLTLDTTRKVAASIATRGWNQTGVGVSEWEFALVGEVAGEEKVLATHTVSTTTGPAEPSLLEFEMELDPALAGAVVDTLRLDVMIDGTFVGGRGIEHDEPASTIKVPALK